jgi:hypothetical protein
MGPMCSSETLVAFYRTTRRYAFILEDTTFHYSFLSVIAFVYCWTHHINHLQIYVLQTSRNYIKCSSSYKTYLPEPPQPK